MGSKIIVVNFPKHQGWQFDGTRARFPFPGDVCDFLYMNSYYGVDFFIIYPFEDMAC